MISRLASEMRICHRFTEMISNDCTLIRFLPFLSALLDGVQQDIDEHVGGYEDQQDADNQTVQTSGLSDGAAHDHGRGNGALALGLTADGFTGLGDGITFTNTRADTSDQGETGADGAASENDTNSEFQHVIFLLEFIGIVFMLRAESGSAVRRVGNQASSGAPVAM